tara:strand:- start:885 stop:1877 length:993 start_codon:yes stop_codon:yes gene_type:complete
MSSYQYICQDDSILLPFLKKNFFSVLHRLIPYGIPANFLTLVSIFVVWSCFAYFIRLDSPNNTDIFIGILAIIFYVIFDHFDGLQAKLTLTGSPLGEILDHFSDVFNSSIIIFILFKSLQIELKWLFYFSVWVNLIAFSVTYLEQCILRKLYFGKIGSLEGVIMILIILCSLMTTQGKIFWTRQSIFDYPVYIFLVFTLILGVIYTVITSLKRLKYFPKSFLHFLITGSILFYFCTNNQISWYLNFLVINAYSADFILKSMKSHLITLEHPKPDLIVYIFFIFLFFNTFFGFEKDVIFLCYGCLISIKIIWDFIKIFSELKHHWVWWNSN